MGLIAADNKIYLSVLGSDGSIRPTVNENTEGAVKRDYESSDGKKGTKFELVYKAIGGKITGLAFYDGDYGKNLQIDITHDAGTHTLSLGTASNFGEDFLKKLPNIDLNEEVVITPYAFEDEKGKMKKGVTITQDGEKIQNFFYDAEKKVNLHGYPKLTQKQIDSFDTDDWKVYFIGARKFLIEYAIKNIPLFATTANKANGSDTKVAYPTNDNDGEDVAF